MDAFREFLDSLSEEELDINPNDLLGNDENKDMTESEKLIELHLNLRGQIESIREVFRARSDDPIAFLADAVQANALLLVLLLEGWSLTMATLICAIACILEVDGIQSLTKGEKDG